MAENPADINRFQSYTGNCFLVIPEGLQSLEGRVGPGGWAVLENLEDLESQGG